MDFNLQCREQFASFRLHYNLNEKKKKINLLKADCIPGNLEYMEVSVFIML